MYKVGFKGNEAAEEINKMKTQVLCTRRHFQGILGNWGYQECGMAVEESSSPGKEPALGRCL